MADKSLKASIQVDMDAKGVAKGVAATNRELDKLNRTARSTSRAVNVSAGIQMAEAGFNVLQTALGALDKRFSELNMTAQKYSAIAAQAAANADVARIQADMRIADALAPGAAAVSRGQADIAAGEAARIEGDAARMNQSMTAFGLAKENLGVSRDILLEGFGGGIAAMMQMAGGDIGGGATAMGGSLLNTLDQLVNPTNYAFAAGDTSARGMPYDPQMAQQNRLLESIDRKQGGQ